MKDKLHSVYNFVEYFIYNYEVVKLNKNFINNMNNARKLEINNTY